jgi:hypothetical protein
MAEQLENVEDIPKSWTHVVAEISEARAKEALAEFQTSVASDGCASFEKIKTNLSLAHFNSCSKSAIYQCHYFRQHSD